MKNILVFLPFFYFLHTPMIKAVDADKEQASIEIKIPEDGYSALTNVKTPYGDLPLAFAMDLGNNYFPVLQISMIKDQLKCPSDGSCQQAHFLISPAFKSGVFKTRKFSGQISKCMENEGTWETMKNDDIVTEELYFFSVPYTKKGKEDIYRHPIKRIVSIITNELLVTLEFPKAAPIIFNIILQKPYQFPQVFAEMMRQYQKVSPVLFKREKPPEFEFIRVLEDDCGEPHLVTEAFDRKNILTLAFPSHNRRMATAHGWVFIETIESDRTSEIGSLDLGSLNFSKVDVKNMTFLGDHYERRLERVITSPGRATATFSIGDFSGCFGAGCGTPVNEKLAYVTFAKDRLSTKIIRKKESSKD